MPKSIIIQGSSRIDGNTNFFCEYLAGLLSCEIHHLTELNLGHFDYNFQNASDDFHPYIDRLIHNYDLWIFASPVYWYSMSGIMKTFFDRITDLLINHKELGRKIRGKSMGVLSVSNDDDLKHCFVVPFELSAGYLGMNYVGHVHAYGDKDLSPVVKIRIDNFSHKIKNTSP